MAQGHPKPWCINWFFFSLVALVWKVYHGTAKMLSRSSNTNLATHQPNQDPLVQTRPQCTTIALPERFCQRDPLFATITSFVDQENPYQAYSVLVMRRTWSMNQIPRSKTERGMSLEIHHWDIHHKTPMFETVVRPFAPWIDTVINR